MVSCIAAVVQASTVMFDRDATVEVARHWMAEAAARGAQVVVFPEAFLGGYPKGADFHIYVGGRTPEGRREFQQYYDGAVDIGGPELKTLASAAAEFRQYVCIGVIERDAGTLYCTAVYLGPDGTILGKHRKLMPTAAERLIWGFGDGSTLRAVDTPFGRLGAAICWENYMPALRLSMYQQNVAFYCAPTVDDRDTWVSTMQHIALEGRCFVLSACQHLKRGAFPESIRNRLDGQGDAPLIRGGSLIIAPSGQILAGPFYNEDGILVATLDLDDLARARFDFDAAGHYARPDVFQLQVDVRAKPAVAFHGAAVAQAGSAAE